MFFVAALLLCSGAHPLDEIRLTPSQMFQLQLPYRYHVRVATFVQREGSEMFELEVEDIYANTIRPNELKSPIDRRVPKGSTEIYALEMEDVLTFPNDRYHCATGYILEGGPSVLVINDRHEKKTVWPLQPDP